MIFSDPAAPRRRLSDSRRLSPIVVLAIILALVLIGAAALVVTLWAPHGRDSSAVTGFVVATVAPTVVALLALVRGDHAVQVGQANAAKLTDTAAVVEQVAENVNGHLAVHMTAPTPPPARPGMATSAADLPVTPTPALADAAPLADQT